ncbi:MAG TPA: glycosyltransferase [Blastocatellia bacterium]|nr:glycosyltransferase [Blastocatellia bacterium]
MNSNSDLVTFAIFAYNQERFIAEAVRAALAQTYSPLEIIISDDSSADATFEVIRQEVSGYEGPHEIRLNRNERNLGFASHINRVMEMARGRLIVAAGGDDVSLPERVERLFAAYDSSGGKALSVYSNATVINEWGERVGPYLVSRGPERLTARWMAERFSAALGCAQSWDRRVFDLFGPLQKEVFNEDMVIPFRAALIGEVKYIDEPLVLYRLHRDNAHFKEARSLKSGHELHAALLKPADSRIAIYKNRLQDLDTMTRLSPDRADEWRSLKVITERVCREMEDEKALLTESKFFKRVAIIGSALRHGTPLRRIIRWVMTYFFPRLYLGYLNRLNAKMYQR